jgi:signal transduction histidine kinase
MKLADKLSIWYLLLTSVVLAFGSILVFFTIKDSIDDEAIERLEENVEFVAQQIATGTPIEQLRSNQVSINELNLQIAEKPFSVKDTMAVFNPREAHDRKLTVSKSFKINGRHYYISIYNFVAEPDEIADGLLDSLTWIALVLLLLIAAGNRIISNYVFKPFRQTLAAINRFSVKEQQELSFRPADTREFDELNHFVKIMFHRAQNEYKSLKEFTENASHELQTPLAIIRGKLELLLDTSLSEQQASHIQNALASLDKLTRINRSLTLLSKLENYQFTNPQPIDIGKKVREQINDCKELMDMKSIKLSMDIDDNILLKMDSSLADILLTNLLNNAIRHNIENGFIAIKLKNEQLSFANSGEELTVPPSQLFERFRKNNHKSETIGLGLSIVKEIADLCQLEINYQYHDRVHEVTLNWKSSRY